MTVYADDLSTLESIELDEDNLDLCARHFARLLKDPLEHGDLRRALSVLREREVDDERFETIGKELAGFENHWKQRVLELESRARRVEVAHEVEAAELRTQMAAFQLAYGEFPESAHATLSHILTSLPDLDAPWRVTVEAMKRADKLKELGVEIETRIKTAQTSRVSIIWLKRLASLNKGMGLDSSMVRIFRQILEADPGDADANFALAGYYREHQQHFESVRILEEFLELVESEDACLSALRLLCEILDSELNDLPAAARHYESILEYEPADSRAIEALERHYRVEDDVEGLLGILSRRVQLGRAGDDEITELVHLSMDRLDRPDDAFRWLCEIYAAHPRPYLQTHLIRLAEVVHQEDAAVDTLLRGIDEQRNDVERLGVIRNILGFVTKLRDVPQQVMELASEGLGNHPSEEMVELYETTLVHYASQKEPREFLEVMEAQAGSELERQSIARIWVSVMDYIPFTPDEWLARAQANVEILEDDDHALEQLADGLKGRGDDHSLAAVYRKRLLADISLKDETWLMDARSLFERLSLADDLDALLTRWTELEGATSAAWLWWAESCSDQSNDLQRLERAVDVLAQEVPSHELVAVCRRLFELVPASRRGHFAASLCTVFPEPDRERCPPRFWLVAVTYLFESRDYDDALIRLSESTNLSQLEHKFAKELFERSMQYSDLPIAWLLCISRIPQYLTIEQGFRDSLARLVEAKAEFVEEIGELLANWNRQSSRECASWCLEHGETISMLGWIDAMRTHQELYNEASLMTLCCELACRFGQRWEDSWRCLIESSSAGPEALADTFAIVMSRSSSEASSEEARLLWTQWQWNAGGVDDALSTIFAEPWPRDPLARSTRWLKIAEIRWLTNEDEGSAEACQSLMSTGIEPAQQWDFLAHIQGWPNFQHERGWRILSAIFSTSSSQLLSDAAFHPVFQSLIRPVSNELKSAIYEFAAPVLQALHFYELWSESAEFLATKSPEKSIRLEWTQKLVAFLEQRSDYERIVRILGGDDLIQTEASENFPRIRNALGEMPSLAPFIQEQARIWRTGLSEDHYPQLDRLDIELKLYYLDDFVGARRLMPSLAARDFENAENWLIDASVTLAKGLASESPDCELMKEWARRSLGGPLEVSRERWSEACSCLEQSDSDDATMWLIEGARFQCLNSESALRLFERSSQLDDSVYVDAARALLNSPLPNEQKTILAERWLGRAKILGDWESWRSAWSILWAAGEIRWQGCETHLPSPGQAFSVLSGIILEFFDHPDRFDHPERPLRWALRYFEDQRFSEDELLAVDRHIDQELFDDYDAVMALLRLRSRQSNVSLSLVERISAVGEARESWAELGELFKCIDLSDLTSEVPPGLIKRRAARYFDRAGSHLEALEIWGDVLEIEPGDQEATSVSIRLLTELERFDELWERLWPAIRFAVQDPCFEERLAVLESILERGASPDASTSEFLHWRMETVEPSIERLNQTLNWFEERHLVKPFEDLCRHTLADAKWEKNLGKEAHLELTIRLAKVLFYDLSTRAEALALLNAVKEVDLYRAGRCEFLETWVQEDYLAAQWVSQLAIEINRDELACTSLLACVRGAPATESDATYRGAVSWLIQKGRPDSLIDFIEEGLKSAAIDDPWHALDHAEEYLRNLNVDARFWLWLFENIDEVRPDERRRHWLVLRAEQLVGRDATDSEILTLLSRDDSVLITMPRAVEIALQHTRDKNDAKQSLTLIENAIGTKAQGKLTWADWYEWAFEHAYDHDWLRVSDLAFQHPELIRDEILAKWYRTASEGVMTPDKAALVWRLSENKNLDDAEVRALLQKIFELEEPSFSELCRALDSLLLHGGELRSSLQYWLLILSHPDCDDGVLAGLLEDWSQRFGSEDIGVGAAMLKFELSRKSEVVNVTRFENIPLEVSSLFGLDELSRIADGLIANNLATRGLLWDLVFRRRLKDENRLTIAGLVDRVQELSDETLGEWLELVYQLLSAEGQLEFCQALGHLRRCEKFVVPALRLLLPEITAGSDEWFEVIQWSVLGSGEILSTEEEKVLEEYLRLGGRDVRAVLLLADALCQRADYRRCIDFLEAQLAFDWGGDEASLLLALFDVYSRVESIHGTMTTLTRLLRTSPSDPAIHALVRESVNSDNYIEILAVLEDVESQDLEQIGRGWIALSIGYIARRFSDTERARKGFDKARSYGLSELTCLDIEHEACVAVEDVRGVMRVQREYDPGTLEPSRIRAMAYWWLRGKASGLALSDRDHGLILQLLERLGNEFELDGPLASQLFELQFYGGLSAYFEGLWLQHFEHPERAEGLVGWVERLAQFSSSAVPDDPRWWLRRFQMQPAWPEGVSLWAEESIRHKRIEDFLELVEAEPDFHAEPYRVRVEVERAKMYLRVREEPEIAADILQFLSEEGQLNGDDLNTLYETALLRSGRWEQWRDRLDAQIKGLDSDDARANLFIKAGELLYQQERRPELAEPFFLRALEIRPESPDGLAALAKLYERSGNFFQAISMLERELNATQSDTRRVDVLNRMGRIHLEMLGDYQSARASYERAHELDRVDLECLDALRQIARHEERLEDYLALLTHSLESSDDLIDFVDLSVEGATVLSARQPEVVLDILDGALTREPQNVELQFRKACIVSGLNGVDSSELWLDLWPRSVSLLPRERAVVAKELANYFHEQEDHKKVVEYGRLAMDFAEPGEGPLQVFLSSLATLELWQELQSFTSDTLAAVEVYPHELHRELSEECSWYSGLAHFELGQNEDAERYLKRAVLSTRWRTFALDTLVALFRRTNNFDELVIYSRDILDQASSEETPREPLELFVIAMTQVGRSSEIFDKVLSWAVRNPKWKVNDVLLNNAGTRDAKTRLVRLFENNFSGNDLDSHNAMIQAGKLYESDFKNESLAVRCYERVLEAEPSNFEALELLESLLGRRAQWRRLGQVYLNLAKSLELRGAVERAFLLAKQTVELAQHALRRDEIGVAAARYLLEFDAISEADARLCFSVMEASEHFTTYRDGLMLLARNGFMVASDIRGFTESEGVAGFSGLKERLSSDFAVDDATSLNIERLGTFHIPDEEIRRFSASCLDSSLGRLLRELWRIAPETLTRRLPLSYFQGDEVVSGRTGSQFVQDLDWVRRALGASTLDVKLRPGSVEGPRVLPIQPMTLLLGKESSLVRTDDTAARTFCLGRLAALTRPEVVVSRLYSGHLLNDVVCGLLHTLGVDAEMALSKRGRAWSDHFSKYGKSRFANLRSEAVQLATVWSPSVVEQYCRRVEEFALAMGLLVCGDLQAAERGLAWVGDPVSSLTTEALRHRLQALALSEHYSVIRFKLWGGH